MVDSVDRGVAVLWALAAAVTTALVELLGHPALLGPVPWWMRGGAVLAFVGFAALSSVTPRRRVPVEHGWPREAWARAASWLVAGVWVAAGWQWGFTGRYWQVRSWRAETWWPQYWLAGLVLAAVATAAAAVYAVPTDLGELDVAGRPNPDPAGPEEWAERLARIARLPGCVVQPAQPWPNGNGYDIVGELPDNGATWAVDLKPAEAKLRASLKLRGGSVEVGPAPGGHDGEFRIRVATTDALAEDWTYTDLFGTGRLSINDRHAVARVPDGGLIEIEPRGRCGMVVSQTGGGKTNFLHTLTANYVRCDDVLPWHIDLGGAGLALPWVSPYLDTDVEADGTLRGCPVDWVASTEDEAILMLEFAVQVIKVRRRQYQRMMLAGNTDVLPCSPSIPGIRIVMDETAEGAGVAGNPQLAALVVRVVQLGRAVEVRIDFSALSATASVLPRDAQKHIGIRALFGVQDEAEVGYALGWRTKLHLPDAGYPGAGWIRRSMADEIRRARPPHTSPPRELAVIARACEARRPRLDEPSLQVPLRAAYLSRWARAVPLLTGSDEPLGEPVSRAHVSLPTRTSVRPDAHPGEGSSGRGGGLDEALARARHIIAGDRVKGAPPERVDAEFERLAGELADDRAAGGEGWTEKGPPTDGDESRGLVQAAAGDLGAVILGVLAGAEDKGMSGPEVHATLRTFGIDVSERTVYRCLEKVAIKAGWGSWVHPGRDKTGGKLP